MEDEAKKGKIMSHDSDDATLLAFLSELTNISHKHGIAISGEPETFLMERDDYAYSYACDDSSRLVLR